jgi:hypothetical protein
MNANNHKYKEFTHEERMQRIKDMDIQLERLNKMKCHNCALMREKLLGVYTAIREHLLHQKDKP